MCCGTLPRLLTRLVPPRSISSPWTSLADLRARYDKAVTWGITTNRHRDWHKGNHPGFTLAQRLNDKAEQDLRVRSCLASSRNHGIRAVDAIHRALTGNPWLPPITA